MERLHRIGEIKCYSSSQVSHSRIGLGFEKLDRDAFDPEKAYDLVAATGVKWARIQSGWQKTETVRGQYDFAWLDRIVDNLLQRGLVPWICLCYGNRLYTPMARDIFGAVGCPPVETQEERDAWARYVTAVARHYRGRVTWFEIWNEPDGSHCWKPEPDGTAYGNFVKATAAAVKAGCPEARLIGGVVCDYTRLDWLADALETGAGSCLDALSFHSYLPNETDCLNNRFDALEALCRAYNPDIRMIQGETGAQSSSLGKGAMFGAAWTPLKQAKFLARHMISDFFRDILFSSYFSIVDMREALGLKNDDPKTYEYFGYFGILSAESDRGTAVGEYRPKPSYRALQSIASLFREDFQRCSLPFQFHSGDWSTRLQGPEPPADDIIRGGFSRPDGSYALAYWKKCDLLTTTYEGTISLDIANMPEEVRLADPLTGAVYELPDGMMEKLGRNTLRFKNLPLLDSPLLLTFGGFAEVLPSI